MKNILITFILSVFLLGISSCDSILDVDPLFTEDAESFFNTPEDYERALIASYDLLQTSYLTSWIGEMASDNAIAGGESVNDTRGLHDIADMNHGGVNDELQLIMRYNYTGIARCNFLFEARGQLENLPNEDRIYAEASFLRAYFYFELVRYFGDMPLIIDRRIGIDEATQIDRAPASEVYAQIERDLLNAVEHLEWTNPTVGRVTKGPALALLGKVYLFQEKFTQAAEVLDRVINEGPYSLLQFETSEEYTAMFTVNQEGNSESVFEIQYTGVQGGSFDCFVCLQGNISPGFNGIRNFVGPIYAPGFSYNLPTENLYNSFDPNDLRRDGAVLNIDAFIAAQPDPSAISFSVGGGGHTGFYNNKYIQRQNELGLPDQRLTSPVNYRVIRLPDVYLMAAEAHNRGGGNDGLAQQYLNNVRERVGLPTVNATGTSLTEAIWQERRWELAGEGLRFWDLVRTGQAAANIEGFQVGKHELFPIPQVEIDLAGGNWQQNPNY
ncbi:MAG: RagB/SusD family nutrient uptake outer membrane protein [Cyclobacteriaceae bacterium]|nr:RagB/SusD family nutrient uptake outer membrane protein [Cyclobacteriaceae bacterium]MCH8515135.1 RagB/SusD family nutrient uptake outer membrane protein [Cyclobacteriaceae bacterium]